MQLNGDSTYTMHIGMLKSGDREGVITIAL